MLKLLLFFGGEKLKSNFLLTSAWTSNPYIDLVGTLKPCNFYSHVLWSDFKVGLVWASIPVCFAVEKYQDGSIDMD